MISHRFQNLMLILQGENLCVLTGLKTYHVPKIKSYLKDEFVALQNRANRGQEMALYVAIFQSYC